MPVDDNAKNPSFRFHRNPYDLMLADPLPMASRTLVMGILNITPDSFSDGGKFISIEAAIEHALVMVAEGADIIDIGGESTRPGSEIVSPHEQQHRVLPVIEALRTESKVAISIDTTLAAVADCALKAGADIVNDISALRDDPGLAGVISRHDCPVILMHMQGQPRSMQNQPVYQDVVKEVADFLVERREVAVAAGIDPGKILLDPGFGFGKTVEHNLTLMAHLDSIVGLGSPVLVGFSRKSTIGTVLDLPCEERLEGSLAMAVMAVAAGAAVLRVHDVKATVRAVRMAEAVKKNK